MITQDLKDKGISCRGKGVNCPGCKDSKECVDYITSKVVEEQQRCYQCQGECVELYQVKVIDEFGKMSFPKVCSHQCALKVKDRFYNLHKNRADDIRTCSIQKLR